MPHQCTGCGHTFADGSKEMLSGCPECGGNKFQFHPEGEPVPEHPEETPSREEPPDPPETPDSSVAETVGRATTKVRDFVSTTPESPAESPDPNAEWPSEAEASSSGTDASSTPESNASSTTESDGEIIDADARRKQRETDDEDLAQASARSDVVSSTELSESERDDDTDDGGLADVEPEAEGRVVSEPSGDDPDLTELREQLNDQFESIKIVEPGQYELNLMELYDREEYIIALQENGRYVIQVPEQWMGDEPGDR
jgi:predicted  nucleic acid-binding Zn-ribbon protein